jgi:hypothetical protein
LKHRKIRQVAKRGDKKVWPNQNKFSKKEKRTGMNW